MNLIIKKYFLVFRCILISVIYLFHPAANAEKSLVFNVTGQPPLNTNKHDGFMDEVTREALKRIGYKLVITRQPAERGLKSTNTGVIDGEMGRVKGINKIYTNLLRVPEKIMDWDFIVFSKKDINTNSRWNSLAHKNVSFINGWKILEKNIPKTAKVTKTKNSQQLFRLLQKDRTDFIIYEHWGGHLILSQLDEQVIKARKPAVVSREMFIYLHKKHAKLIPKLSRALTSMKKDGSYYRLKKKYLKHGAAGH